MSTKLEIWNGSLIRCGAEPVATLVEENKRSSMLRNQYNITLRDLLNDSTWNFATSREIVLTKSGVPSFGFGHSYLKPDNVLRILELSQGCEYKVEGNQVLTNYDDKATSVTINHVGVTATVTQTSHGYATGQKVYVGGANPSNYNGTFVITVIDNNSYSYTMLADPGLPALGAPFAMLDAAVLRAKGILFIEDPLLFTASFVKVFVLKLAEDISYGLVQSASLQNSIISEAERYLRRARSYNSQEGTPSDRYPTDYTWSERL